MRPRQPYDGPIRPEGVYVRYVDPQGHTRAMIRAPLEDALVAPITRVVPPRAPGAPGG